MRVDRWMSWEAGVDLLAATRPGLERPNVLVHVARMVHTPFGSAPAGMVLYQPDPNEQPAVFGFVCDDPDVGGYFGPWIFAGTPFEQAPVLRGSIEIWTDLPAAVGSRVSVSGHLFEVRLNGLSDLELIHRAPIPMVPFWQQGVESGARGAILVVDGVPVEVFLLAAGLSGGPAAVWAPCGVYARDGGAAA